MKTWSSSCRARALPLALMGALGVLTACATGGPATGPGALSGGGAAATSPAAAPVTAVPPAATDPGAAPPSSVPVTTGTASPAASDSAGDGRLPSTFPLPPGAGPPHVVTVDGNIAATLTVADPNAAYQFWLTALPRAGYTIQPGNGIVTVNGLVVGAFNIAGNGYSAASAVAIRGSDVKIGLQAG